jgi:diaminohydroxyphosphoribosylaminopyrimidine deaminase / 5-amino-6-(5-phosphoribosylamino)uracil reductase
MQDEIYMQQALDLAKKAAGRVSPNPMVGCVIVKNGKTLSKSYHKKYGSHHAEVNALKPLKGMAKGATMYVTLEPCHHHGNTPPCVEAVIRAQVKRVVIAMKDPDPRTAGKSIRKLKKAGIEVKVGVLKTAAEELNRFFIKQITTGKPYVIAKVAQSLDGKITATRGKQTWLTGKAAKKYVQRLRSEVDAVLVGRQTILIDDPQLNVRDAKKPQPKRIVLDSKLRLPLTKNIFKVHGGEVILVCALPENNARVRKYREQGVSVLCAGSKGQKVDLKILLKKLSLLRVNSLLVEGGAKVFTACYEQQIVDEWRFIVAPKTIGNQGVPVFLLSETPAFDFKEILPLGSDCLISAFSAK